MKMIEAIEESIRAFYKGKLPENAIKASDEEFIYTLDYFERMLSDQKPDAPKKEARNANRTKV